MGMHQDLNLTERAEDAFFDMETNPKFQDQDQASKIIWEEVKKRIPTFSSYLKRYINSREGISWDDEKPLNFYQDLIVYEFQRRGVPVSFILYPNIRDCLAKSASFSGSGLSCTR